MKLTGLARNPERVADLGVAIRPFDCDAPGHAGGDAQAERIGFS